MFMSFLKTESVSLYLSGRKHFPPLLPKLLKVNYNYYYYYLMSDVHTCTYIHTYIHDTYIHNTYMYINTHIQS